MSSLHEIVTDYARVAQAFYPRVAPSIVAQDIEKYAKRKLRQAKRRYPDDEAKQLRHTESAILHNLRAKLATVSGTMH